VLRWSKTNILFKDKHVSRCSFDHNAEDFPTSKTLLDGL
jgi:hypothetical protein